MVRVLHKATACDCNNESNLSHVIRNIESNGVFNVTSGCVNLTDQYWTEASVENMSNIVLVGVGNSAKIVCRQSVDPEFSPFIFYNVTNLTIRGIEFENCGGGFISKYSKHHWHNYTKTLFLFHICESVSIFHVNITKYNGCALMFLNSHQIMIENVHVVRNSSVEWPFGGGIYLKFLDHDAKDEHVMLTNVHISESYQVNCKHISRFQIHQKDSLFGYLPVWQAQGLTVTFKQTNYAVHVKLVDSSILNNSGCNCSGIFVSYDSSLTDSSSLEIIGSTLSNNNISSNSSTAGSSLLVFLTNGFFNETEEKDHSHAKASVFRSKNNSSPFIIFHDVLVKDHKSRTPIHVLNLRSEIDYDATILMERVTFTNNIVKDQAICFSVVSLYESQDDNANMQINMINTMAYDNSQFNSVQSITNPVAIPEVSSALFLFINVDAIIINHTSSEYRYYSNSASIFLGISTDFLLEGNIRFENNKAEVGTCFQLRSFTHIFLGERVNVSFIGNNATTVGGAIASFSEGNEYSMCFLQPKCPQTHNHQIQFKNNFARFAGNDIYGDQVYRCFINQIYNVTYFYEGIFSHYNRKNIIAKPFSVQLNNSIIDGVYPGSKINLTLKVIDINGNPVPAYVFTSFGENDIDLSSNTFGYNMTSNDREDEQYQNFTFSILVKNKLSVRLISKKSINIYLYLSTAYGKEYSELTVEMKMCPVGFYLNQGCKCYKFLKKKAKSCTIESGRVIYKSNVWVRCWRKKTTTVCEYANVCLKGYCKNSATNISKQADALCEGNRKGKICGSCKNDYSAQFGTRQCGICTNIYLLMIPAMGGIGLLIVLKIYTLRLTLDQGTIGGVIFYANVIELGIINPSVDKVIPKISYWFVRLLNIQTGAPVCFYNGMTDLHKQFLQFLFPLYMCLIVIFIVFISRHSTRISNLTSHLSVQVLVTLIHLSFARLLSAVIETFSLMKLYTVHINTHHDSSGENQMVSSTKLSNVWLFSGDVKYGKDAQHLVLLIIAGTLTLLVLLPYLVLSLLAPFLYCHPWINKMKPAFDTMFAPYKEKYRHWFGYRLTVFWFISVNFAVLAGTNEPLERHIQVTVLLIYTLSLAVHQPMKQKILNYIEIWLSANAAFCALLEMHTTRKVYNFKIALIFSAFLLACLIIIYHVLLALKLLPGINKITSKCSRRLCHKPLVNALADMESPLETSAGNYYGSINSNSQLRESLLSSASCTVAN